LDAWDNWPYDWTRDSKAILFGSFRNGKSVVLEQRINSGIPEILLSSAEGFSPYLSPNGDRLLYTSYSQADRSAQLMSAPLDGGPSAALMPGEYRYRCGYLPSAGCVLGEIQGMQLVFSRLDPVEGKGEEIMRVDVHSRPDWSLSPDGNKIAIVDPLDSAGQIRILTLADRKVTTRALKGWTWNSVQSVSWAANSNDLFATVWGGTSVAILFVEDGGNLQVLEKATPSEAWLNGVVVSPDGHHLAYMKRSFGSNAIMLEHF
jgi:dipeptidyl aminopeptidase/acylaminoacyl peptidase